MDVLFSKETDKKGKTLYKIALYQGDFENYQRATLFYTDKDITDTLMKALNKIKYIDVQSMNQWERNI